MTRAWMWIVFVGSLMLIGSIGLLIWTDSMRNGGGLAGSTEPMIGGDSYRRLNWIGGLFSLASLFLLFGGFWLRSRAKAQRSAFARSVKR